MQLVPAVRPLALHATALAFLASPLAGCGGAGAVTGPSSGITASPQGEAGRGSFYLNGAADGSGYRVYHESGAAFPCPEKYCAHPSAVLLKGGAELVFAESFTHGDRRDARITVWTGGGAFIRKLEVVGTHPEVKRLPDGSWAMLVLNWPGAGGGLPKSASLWTAPDAMGPWTPKGVVHASSSAADGRGFSIDYWCQEGVRWLLYTSTYPDNPDEGSAMALSEASRMEGPYSSAVPFLRPGRLDLVDGLPILQRNLSPSSIYRERGRWRMIGTGYGVTDDGVWYERTFFLNGATARGPWVPTTEPAFFAPAGLSSFENAEPAVAGTSCAAE